MRCVLLEGLSLREADGKIQEDPIRKINEVKHSCNVGRQKKLFLVLAVMSLNIKETKYVQCYQCTVQYREGGCIGLYLHIYTSQMTNRIQMTTRFPEYEVELEALRLLILVYLRQ